MATQASPFTDHAAPVLAGDPALTDEKRADLHDAFYSKNADELTQHLMPMQDVPEDTKTALFAAKQKSTPVRAPLDAATDAMTHLSQIDPKVLDLAESHPNVLKVLTAAIAPAKGAQDAAGGVSAPAKGKVAGKAKKPVTLTPDIPATPPAHALVQASDGGLYHVPVANIDAARQHDPQLKVLHSEPDEAEVA